MERLQKVISQSGYCSRRKAEELIIKGLVRVNDNIITELGFKVTKKDEIIIDGIKLKASFKKYYLLYKPAGVLSTTKDERGRKTVIDLIKPDIRIFPVGRLDYDTTGIILLTNDGELTNRITHPSNKIEKKYLVKIKGLINYKDIKLLKSGIKIDNRKTSPAKVKLKRLNKKNNTSILEIVIHEGRYHQIKRMFEALDYQVLKLKRESISFLTLKGLKTGQYRELNIKEIKKLYALTNKG